MEAKRGGKAEEINEGCGGNGGKNGRMEGKMEGKTSSRKDGGTVERAEGLTGGEEAKGKKRNICSGRRSASIPAPLDLD